MLKVIIAEDEVILADMLEDLLISGGYKVCGKARTVKEAVALVNLHKPDLAVLDYRLADGDYSSQIPPLLNNRRHTGILYASGHRLDNVLTRTDGEAYIRKPYKVNDLLLALRIVHDIRTGIGAPDTPLPKNFHILSELLVADRMST